MSTSKLQRECKRVLTYHFGKYTILQNYRPEWLTNKTTGKPLELDFYIPDLEIAVEVQGRQHVEFTPFFHAEYRDFLRRKRYDTEKSRMCKENRVHLFEVFSERDVHDLMWKIRNLELTRLAEKKQWADFSWISAFHSMASDLRTLAISRGVVTESVYGTKLHNARRKLAHLMARFEATESGKPPPDAIIDLLEAYLLAAAGIFDTSPYKHIIRQCHIENEQNQRDMDALRRYRYVVAKRFNHVAKLMSAGVSNHHTAAHKRLADEWGYLGGAKAKTATLEQLQLKMQWLQEREAEVRANWIQDAPPEESESNQ